MHATLHLAFCGGGYAGQVAAGLAVVDHVREAIGDAYCTFFGPGHSLDRHSVRQSRHNYICIPACPAPRGPLEVFRFLSDNVVGYCAARWLLAEQQVSLLVAVSGYASATIVRAALARGIPTILLEPNASPCSTTRRFAKSATVLCAGFDTLKAKLPAGANIHVTGNPLARAFETAVPSSVPRPTSVPRLVVLGGKVGARILNEVAPEALGRLRDRASQWRIVHQAGDGHVKAVEERYQQAGLDALVLGKIDDRAELLSRSNLVVSRAGGFGLAELAAVGVPAVVIPNREAPDDHQFANAQLFQEAGAVRTVDEDVSGDRLAADLAMHIDPLLSNADGRRQMSVAMRKLSRTDAAQQLAHFVHELYGGDEARAAA